MTTITTRVRYQPPSRSVVVLREDELRLWVKDGRVKQRETTKRSLFVSASVDYSAAFVCDSLCVSAEGEHSLRVHLHVLFCPRSHGKHLHLFAPPDSQQDPGFLGPVRRLQRETGSSRLREST